MKHKNIPGGDARGNTDPSEYPQHAFLIVRDNAAGKEWIVRAGPGGEGGDPVFGSIKAVMKRNGPNATLDSGAQVNHSQNVLTVDGAPDSVVSQLKGYTNAVNDAQISYNPLNSNSNSFAYQGVELITGSRPSIQGVWAPGSQTALEVNQ